MSTEPAPTGQDDARRDAARELWALLHNGRRPEGHQDVESERYYQRVVDLFLARPAVQAVARALIGQGVSYTEWCVYWDDEDPNACSFMPTQDGVGELMTYDDLHEVRQMRRIILDDGRHVGGIARRQVTVHRTPWQVVDTEGGE